MKNKLKKVINKKTLPFILLFLVMISFNVFKSTTANDDLWFSKIITKELAPEITNFSKYKEWRYETWSSRIIIEFFL